MSSVKWIKLTTNMFEDEKIDFIESLPEADSILYRVINRLYENEKPIIITTNSLNAGYVMTMS